MQTDQELGYLDHKLAAEFFVEMQMLCCEIDRTV